MLSSNTLTNRLKIAGVSAMAGAMALGGGAIAQDATPQATPAGPSTGYPVAIHSGTCGDLSAEPAYQIGEAITFGVGDEGEPETIGAEGGVTTVLLGVSATVDSDLETLGSDGHAIAVHAGPDDATVIACGPIAGAVNDGELALAIAPIEDGTVVGVAVLNEDGDETMAKVYLFDTAAADDDLSATPEA